MRDGRNGVLIVEDEDELLTVYDRVLSEYYDVSTAETGAEAVETMSDDIDVVLLDRRLPDADGAALVDELQNRHRDCYVALVTAVEPDFDIIELGLDDYLVKPVTTEQLCDTVDRLRSLAEYDATYRALSQKRVKRNVLVKEKTSTQLRRCEEFERLRSEIERLESELDNIVETIGETPRELEH